MNHSNISSTITPDLFCEDCQKFFHISVQSLDNIIEQHNTFEQYCVDNGLAWVPLAPRGGLLPAIFYYFTVFHPKILWTRGILSTVGLLDAILEDLRFVMGKFSFDGDNLTSKAPSLRLKQRNYGILEELIFHKKYDSVSDTNFVKYYFPTLSNFFRITIILVFISGSRHITVSKFGEFHENITVIRRNNALNQSRVDLGVSSFLMNSHIKEQLKVFFSMFC